MSKNTTDHVAARVATANFLTFTGVAHALLL